MATVNGALGVAIANGFPATVATAASIVGSLGVAQGFGYTASVSNGSITIPILPPYITVYFWKRVA